MKNITKEETNKMLNEFRECKYAKLSDKKYMAYIFIKDHIDGNEKFRKYFMNIIFYLTENYSSENCEKMEEFFQNESGYYLIMENIEYDEPPEKKFDPEFIKYYFNQINNELDRRHKFGLYDHVFSDEDLGIKYLDNKKSKFRVILKFITFIKQMDFRFRSIHFSLSKLLNIYKIDPELRDKFSNIISMKKEDFKKSFENIAYNINSKNEIYNLGIMMRKFIGKK